MIDYVCTYDQFSEIQLYNCLVDSQATNYNRIDTKILCYSYGSNVK